MPVPDTVTVSVTESIDGIAAAMQTFVDNYNKLHDKLDTYTAFDSTAGTKGTLFGSPETVRIESDLSRLVTGQQSFSKNGITAAANAAAVAQAIVNNPGGNYFNVHTTLNTGGAVRGQLVRTN